MGEVELTRFVALDFVANVGLVATLGEEREQPIIGVAHYMTEGAAHLRERFVLCGYARLTEARGQMRVS